MRPRGRPPIPRATSSESAPVEMDGMATWAWSLIFMTEPLPYCRSIWLNAASRACSRVESVKASTSQRNRLENLVLRPGWPQHRMIESHFGRTDRPQVGQRRPELGRPAEAEDGHVRQPSAALALVDAQPLQT